MNRHKKWGIIALVICIIGGIVMFSLNHQKEKTLEEKMRIEQDRMALFVVNRVKLKTQNPIETIEFIEFRKNETIGTWRITLVINGMATISLSEDAFGDVIRTSGYYLEDMSVDETDVPYTKTIDNIKISYLI
ncbi:hypothetical protein QM385_08780 [Streptococcus mitis]|uniref:Uncharacterized protein n=1 Tax=Streptococcus mitis TaxID=28037 RepID=A0A428DH23_STRMT|nr:hypothetical protein [Streptococcus mitis]RSI93479.1 hypothetical protein D8845_03585 [Streptococcus mitis]